MVILEKSAQQAEESSEAAEEPEGTLARGKLKWFDSTKGFGFVKRDSVVCEAGEPIGEVQEGENDVFFTRQHLADSDLEFEEGTPVSFQLVWSEDGKPQARDVRELDVEEESKAEEPEPEPFNICGFVARAWEEGQLDWDARARILIVQAEAIAPDSKELAEARDFVSKEPPRPLSAAKAAAEAVVTEVIATAAAEVVSSGYVESPGAFAEPMQVAKRLSLAHDQPEEAVHEAQKQAIQMLDIASEERKVSYERLRELFEALEEARRQAEEEILAGDAPSEQEEPVTEQEQGEQSLVSEYVAPDYEEQMAFGPDDGDSISEDEEQISEEIEDPEPSVGEQLCELLVELSKRSFRCCPELHEDYVVLAQEIDARARGRNLSSEELPDFLERARLINERLNEAEAAEMEELVSQVAQREGIPRYVAEGNGKVPIQKNQRPEMMLELA